MSKRPIVLIKKMMHLMLNYFAETSCSYPKCSHFLRQFEGTLFVDLHNDIQVHIALACGLVEIIVTQAPKN